MSLPADLLKPGLLVEYKRARYVISVASALGNLRLSPCFYNEEAETFSCDAEDPALSVPLYDWNNRARVARFLEVSRGVPGYKFLDGVTSVPSGSSAALLGESIRRCVAGDPPLLGMLGPWESDNHPYEYHRCTSRPVLVSIFENYRVVRVAQVHDYKTDFRGWEVDYQSGPTPHYVKKDRNDFGPPAPRISLMGEEHKGEGMEICDGHLKKHWLLL